MSLEKSVIGSDEDKQHMHYSRATSILLSKQRRSEIARRASHVTPKSSCFMTGNVTSTYIRALPLCAKKII